MGLAWIADGLDTEGELISVEKDPTLLDIARQFFGEDPRIQLVNEEASSWIEAHKDLQFDLICRYLGRKIFRFRARSSHGKAQRILFN